MGFKSVYRAACGKLGRGQADGILALAAINAMSTTIYWLGPYEFRAFGREITVQGKSKKNLWGRFGGGWNFALGIHGWPPTVFYLGAFTVRIDRIRKEEVPDDGKETEA